MKSLFSMDYTNYVNQTKSLINKKLDSQGVDARDDILSHTTQQIFSLHLDHAASLGVAKYKSGRFTIEIFIPYTGPKTLLEVCPYTYEQRKSGMFSHINLRSATYDDDFVILYLDNSSMDDLKEQIITVMDYVKQTAALVLEKSVEFDNEFIKHIDSYIQAINQKAEDERIRAERDEKEMEEFFAGIPVKRVKENEQIYP